jgi:hypothetical protein
VILLRAFYIVRAGVFAADTNGAGKHQAQNKLAIACFGPVGFQCISALQQQHFNNISR